MKLLIITQKVDQNDDVLGFFHGWLKVLAKYFEKITVICLELGTYDLPDNVAVFSLGKETGRSRIKYVLNFYRLIWSLRPQYQKVFIHMNQEYALLGGLLWRVWGQKIYLWRNHLQGNLATRLAVWLSSLVFYTSPQSYTAQFKKARQMPVGVNTDFFKPDSGVERRSRSILVLGRISPVKELKLVIHTLLELYQAGEKFTATVVGSPVTKSDLQYEEQLRLLAEPLTRSNLLKFVPAVAHARTLSFYQSHEIYVNLTRPGSFDKTVLEAAACGCVPFSHIAVQGQNVGVVLPDLDPHKNALRIAGWFDQTGDQRKDEIRLQLQSFVNDNHSLEMLARQLRDTLKY